MFDCLFLFVPHLYFLILHYNTDCYLKVVAVLMMFLIMHHSISWVQILPHFSFFYLELCYKLTPQLSNKLTSTRQQNKYLLEYIRYMFRPVNRSSSGLQQNKSQVLFRYWDPNIFTVVNVEHKIWYWIKCETYNVWLKQIKPWVCIWHFGQVLSPLECSLDYGCYCAFTRCGEICLVQPAMVVRVVQSI